MRSKNMQVLTDDVKQRHPGVVIYGIGDDAHKKRRSGHNEDDTPGSLPEREDADNKPEHRAIDIMAPWGTPVLAADDGHVTKVSSNRGGGLAVYQADASGRFLYYYAHLAGYAEGLHDGQPVRRGEVIGYVGATGNAPDHAPHLHFAVQYTDNAKRWARLWGRGEAVNPYAALAH